MLVKILSIGLFLIQISSAQENSDFLVSLAKALIDSLFPNGVPRNEALQTRSQNSLFSPAFFQPAPVRNAFPVSKLLPNNNAVRRNVVEEPKYSKPSYGAERLENQLREDFEFSSPRNYENSEYREAPQLLDGGSWGPKWGLQGRTDLPAEYVYPFAKQGSMIRPGPLTGTAYQLGPNPPNRDWEIPNQHYPSGRRIETGQELFNFPTNNWEPPPTPPPEPALRQVFYPKTEKSEEDYQQDNLPTPPSLPVVSFTETSNVLDFRRRLEVGNSPRQERISQVLKIDRDSETCGSCIYTNMLTLQGPWTQIYGSKEGLKGIYSVLMSLKDRNMIFGAETTKMDLHPSTPSCVGLQIGRYARKARNLQEASSNLFFRDGTLDRRLYEMSGVAERNMTENPTWVTLDYPEMKLPMCLMKLGPQRRYMILAETTGPLRCKSYHVFARDPAEFFRTDDNAVVEYLKKKIEAGAKQMEVLPFPELCQV